MRALRAASVIARRDFVAIVRSRMFLLFLATPLLAAGLAALIGAGGGDGRGARVRPVAVASDPATARALVEARGRVTALVGDVVPPLQVAATARAGDPRWAAVLSGTLERPALGGSREAVAALAGPLALVVASARRGPDVVRFERHVVDRPAIRDDDRGGLARGAQVALFAITLALASMLVSTLVEEKSNKVIEVLAAAVPLDAIFLGKLIAIMGVSLVALAVWGGIGAAAAIGLMPAGGLPAPAVGWPAFVVLGACYFVTAFLLIGALYLGIGAQASSMREVQLVSLPLTIAQALLLAFAGATVGHASGGVVWVGIAVPWSSPLVMIARAAERPELWPHLPALFWQLVWLAITVRLTARLFRASVQGGGGSPWCRPRLKA